MEQNDLTLENMEKLGAQKQANFFFNHIDGVLKEIDENSLIEKIQNNDFEILGMLCFLVGIDYTAQEYKQNNILNNVRERFKAVNLSQNVIDVFTQKITEIYNTYGKDITKLFGAIIEENKNGVTKEAAINNELRNTIIRILENCIFDISYAEFVADLLDTKQTITYEKIFKFNNFLNQEATYSGDLCESIKKLYGDEEFNRILKNMVDKYDKAKFTFIYEESLLSCVETVEKFSFDFAEVSEEEEKNKFEAKQKDKNQEPVESTDAIEPRKSYSREQSEDIMNNHPYLFVQTILEEQINSTIDSFNITRAIDELIKNEDLLQHIYHYMSKNIEKLKDSETTISKDDNLAFVSMTKVKADYHKEEYKFNVEVICKKIKDEDKKIINLVNSCIEYCALSTPEQKQYLISQLIENGIETYNHLQQIVSVIESCKIFGYAVPRYIKLRNSIENNERLKEVFKLSNELSTIELKLSVYDLFYKWYSAAVKE